MRRQKKKSNVKNSEPVLRSLKGVVTPRKCERCSHHEMGIMTEEGEYLALKKGMKVILIGG